MSESKGQKSADGDLPESLGALQKVLDEEANEAVKVGLPKKILSLNELCKTLASRVEEVRAKQQSLIPSEEALVEYAKVKAEFEAAEASIKTDGSKGSKKRKLEGKGDEGGSGSITPQPPQVGSNDGVSEVLKVLTNEVIEGIELLGKVKTWIQLRIPKIEAGNNFGVAVQEECVGELHRVEDYGFAVLEATTKYHCRRARLSHKLIKHPLLHDYRQAIVECDDAQCDLISLTAIELRNSLFVLHDMLTKNFEKILKPRTDNTASHMMY